jgi:hypothetical protein
MAKRARGVALVVNHLPCNHKALSSKCQKKKKKKERKVSVGKEQEKTNPEHYLWEYKFIQHCRKW